MNVYKLCYFKDFNIGATNAISFEEDNSKEKKMRPYKKRVIISQAQLHNENDMETDNSEDSDPQVSLTNLVNGFVNLIFFIINYYRVVPYIPHKKTKVTEKKAEKNGREKYPGSNFDITTLSFLPLVNVSFIYVYCITHNNSLRLFRNVETLNTHTQCSKIGSTKLVWSKIGSSEC